MEEIDVVDGERAKGNKKEIQASLSIAMPQPRLLMTAPDTRTQ